MISRTTKLRQDVVTKVYRNKPVSTHGKLQFSMALKEGGLHYWLLLNPANFAQFDYKLTVAEMR